MVNHHAVAFSALLHSDVGMCRICHEGAGGETLLSPCDCTGTLGKVHKSCLEKWLSSSNTSYCELCHTEFTIERRPQPLTQVRMFTAAVNDLTIFAVGTKTGRKSKINLYKASQSIFPYSPCIYVSRCWLVQIF